MESGEGLLEVLRSKITYEIKDRIIKIDSAFLFVRMGKSGTCRMISSGSIRRRNHNIAPLTKLPASMCRDRDESELALGTILRLVLEDRYL